ncbi:MAG: GIY-YIG nuclease family protein [Deltaproteobacteria bacterium]|nr:GIY-YIG nuclease family protein [Deltaproteobacteria bacterium]
MKFVYLIQSIPFPNQQYIGITSEVSHRLAVHNEGGSSHTSKDRPWKTEKAVAFERYLESHSNRAFASKHF